MSDSDMMADPERDAALLGALAHVAQLGWTMEAVRAALAEQGATPDDATLLFPGGAAELVEAFVVLADRWMAEDAAAADMAGLGKTKRVRAVIGLRLARLRPYKEAVRLAIGFLALPHQVRLGLRLTRGTIDAIWHAAGDTLEDRSRHTKRPILGVVYGSTLMMWLRDATPDDAPSLAFLDRRLSDVGRIGKLRGKIEARLGNIICRQSSLA